MKRRAFLNTLLAGAQCAALMAAGLLRPQTVLAEWPAAAFTAQSVETALRALTGGAPIAESDAVVLKMADAVEDGRTVPLEIISRLSGTQTIAVLSEPNPFPAMARFTLTPAVAPHLHTRIKVGGSGLVIALVEAEGRFYRTAHRITAPEGAC